LSIFFSNYRDLSWNFYS